MWIRGGAAAAILIFGQMASFDALARPQRQPAARPAATAQPAKPPETAETRRQRLAQEVRKAAHAIGFDPEILLAIVMAESSLREHVRNFRSSAAGPLQFSVATWMSCIPRFAARIPELAAHARRREQLAEREQALSRLRLSPRQRRARLAALRREQAAAERAALALRHDIRVSAQVAAALAQEDAGRFRSLTGEHPANAGEIYAVHMLGVSAAADLTKAVRQHPGVSTAKILPAEVLRANPEIFLGPDDKPLPARQARERIAARLGPVEPAPVLVAEAP